MTEQREPELIVISDGTGETAVAAVRAAATQFLERFRVRTFGETRHESQVRRVMERAAEDGALVVFTVVNESTTRLIRELKPYRVVCQDPTTVFFSNSYVNHPDHRAAGEATIYAVFPSAETRPIFPELLAEGFEPHKVSELYLDMSFEPGDIQLISNHFTLHARTAYEDDPQRPRHLLRLWLSL